MKFKIRVSRVVIETVEKVSENYRLTSNFVQRKRKNQDPYSFRLCIWCNKRIDKDQELAWELVDGDTLTRYNYHNKCFQEMRQEIEG